jgi:Poxvirus A32 protein
MNNEQMKILPIWEKGKVVFNNKDLPSGFRMLIVGPTGLGKTTLLLKMLIYNLDFENLIICSPSMQYQPEYQIFINALKKGLSLSHIESIFQNQDDIDNADELIDEVAEKLQNRRNHDERERGINVEIYNDPELLPEPEKLVTLINKNKQKKQMKNLVIIDDCLKKKQSIIQNYFVYGRPLGINTVYLTQAYFRVDKDTIRNNCQVFIVFEISNTDLKNSYEQLGSKTFDTLEAYKQYAKEAWEQVKDKDGRNRGYFVVDLTKPASSRLTKNSF